MNVAHSAYPTYRSIPCRVIPSRLIAPFYPHLLQVRANPHTHMARHTIHSGDAMHQCVRVPEIPPRAVAWREVIRVRDSGLSCATHENRVSELASRGLTIRVTK